MDELKKKEGVKAAGKDVIDIEMLKNGSIS